jgi:hypothetical protein
MPATLTFFRLPEEESAFIEFAETTGDVVFFPYGSGRSDDERRIPHPLGEYLRKHDPDRGALGLVSLAIDPATGCSRTRSINPVAAPLVGYTRGKFLDPNTLTGTSLVTYSSYLDDRKQLVKQAPEFERWRKKLFQWARSATETSSSGWPATPAVIARMRDGLKLGP